MSYATRQSMIDQYGEEELIGLTDRSGADTIDEARLASAIDDAAAEINGWIAKRVALPLDPVPRALERHARAIAYFILFDQRGTSDVSEPRKRYEDALAFLKAVSRGEVSLGDEVPGDSTDASPGVVVTDAPEREFTRDTMRGW